MNAILFHFDNFFTWLIHTSWESSLVVLLILGAQFLFKRLLPVRWRYALWILVVLRLTLPVLPHSPFSLLHIPRALSTVEDLHLVAGLGPFSTFAESGQVNATAKITALPHRRAALHWPSFGMEYYDLIWLAGALAFGLVILVKTRRFTRSLRTAQPCRDAATLDIASACATEIGINRNIRILSTPMVSGPAMIGVLSPILLLPEGLIGSFSPDEMRIVFLHEFAHLRRGDTVLNALLVVLQILHWFNPALWFAFSRMRHDRELATDSLVLSGTRASLKTLYANTLLRLIEGFDTGIVSPRLVGIVENPKDIKDRILRITQATPGAYRWSVLGLALLVLIGVAALTQGMADFSPVLPAALPVSSTTPPVLDTNKESTLIYRADIPAGVWNGWGYASPPDPSAAAQSASGPEKFEIIHNAPGSPRTFSGRIAGLDSMQGVEVGLISLEGIYWNVKDAYQWEAVAPDGRFSITNARYNSDGKILVMRGPKTAWTFLRYNFRPDESAQNIILNAAASRKVRITASGSDMKNLSKVWVEGFDAHTQTDDSGAALRRQHHGYFEAHDADHVDIVLPVGEIALFIHRPGYAGFYKVIDTRKADHFHFVLNAAGQLRMTSLDAQGNPRKGVQLYWINPAAPLSLGQETTKENGQLVADCLVPGSYQVNIGGINVPQVQVQGGCQTVVLIQEGKDPVISQTTAAN